jgi:NAD(P)H-dependent flavin oxidoreductase YrpB (nitropropane dioxygenase family)
MMGDMTLRTAFTELFSVQHPIALAPMGGASGGALAAAVSNGGGQLTSVVDDIRLVLSFDYERHFNSIARGASNRGLNPKNLECSRWGHFDLIGSRFLKDRLEGVL